MNPKRNPRILQACVIVTLALHRLPDHDAVVDEINDACGDDLELMHACAAVLEMACAAPCGKETPR